MKNSLSGPGSQKFLLQAAGADSGPAGGLNPEASGEGLQVQNPAHTADEGEVNRSVSGCLLVSCKTISPVTKPGSNAGEKRPDSRTW